jgi:sterol desaturase/sphingolipid hydroxylase (fatty acid hydroxylase superfamily)
MTATPAMLRNPALLVLALLACTLLGMAPLEAAAQLGNEPPPESALDRMYGPYAPFIRQAAQVLLHLGIVCLVALPFQALFPGVRRKPKVLSYEYWLDVVYWCQGIWLGLLSFYVLANAVAGAIYGDNVRWFPWLVELPFWVQALIALWAFDFAVYWRHRFEHMFSALWAFHAVHHTAEKVDVLTTLRVHPFELLLGVLFNTAIIRAGLHPAAIAMGGAVYIYYNYFIHTNVRIRFPGFLKYVLVSPFMHQWHHATDEAAAGKNVGVVFAWNDWLFGTAYHPDHWPTQFGLSGPAAERVPQSYVRHLLYPLQFLFVRTMAWRSQGAKA